MKRESLITVIVPIYNVESFIENCIKSIMNQTYPYLEVILVNDGTQDASMDIAKELTQNDERFVYLGQENMGLSAARNNAINIANGKYLSFVDSDDFIDKFHYELMYREIVKEAADICVCDVALVREDVSYISTRKNKHITSITGKEAFIDEVQGISILSVAPAKLYKKELFDNIRYPEGLFYEDKATTYKLFLLSKKVCFVNKSLYSYTQRKHSITKSLNNKKIDDRITVLSEMKEYLVAKELYDTFKKEYIACYLLNVPLALATAIAMHSSDYEVQMKYLLDRVNMNYFKLKNIFLLRKNNSKKMLGLVLLLFNKRMFKAVAVREKTRELS